MQNIFQREDCDQFINRINQLEIDSQPLWSKMSVDQMLAHCNVTYEMVYDNIHVKPNVFVRLILKLLAKNAIVSEKPYARNISYSSTIYYCRRS
ncbi:DinB family protein [Flavobacterium panici]|uniref:DinB family protein n=1 Tax=Flavobacterium panici TaxID=2654843 RepID=A0A9N8J877_9FLAO|nr:DinB family protein [Flavobacterium panici]